METVLESLSYSHSALDITELLNESFPYDRNITSISQFYAHRPDLHDHKPDTVAFKPCYITDL